MTGVPWTLVNTPTQAPQPCRRSGPWVICAHYAFGTEFNLQVGCGGLLTDITRLTGRQRGGISPFGRGPKIA
jgi:hypothetical protein